MENAEFESARQVNTWLRDKPSSWKKTIYVRSSLRALPTMASTSETWLKFHAVSLFQANLIAWAALDFRELQIEEAARLSQGSLQQALRRAYDDNFASEAILIATGAVLSSSGQKAEHVFEWRENVNLQNSSAIEQVGSSYQLKPTGTPILKEQTDLLKAVEDERDWLDQRPQDDFTALEMVSHNLWFGGLPENRKAELLLLKEKLFKGDPTYAVWIDWYERRIRGERAAFDIPGDKGRKEDKAILRKLAEATDEDFWGKGHEYVNATLKGWIDEARARCLPPVIAEVSGAFEISGSAEGRVGPTPSQIAEALERQASPQARIIDGKLDAVPNAIFDKPQYSDNLATLPSEMMAFADVILSSLPRNCEPLVRNCFAGHRDELLVRGNRPILNILKGMSASLIAEIYLEADLTISPDEWVLRDPREWGAGLTAMFAQFFKGHLDLVHHFPLDEEREELIANVPIDEVAASGDALTKPVDEVAALIIELGKQGFATENIVRIVEAHALYNRDIAQLPVEAVPDNVVTPKRRHVLMTRGFYLNLYNVMGSTASLWPFAKDAFVATLPRLKEAIDALAAFFR